MTDKNLLSWVDYVVFGGLLAASAFIGVFHGFFGKKMENTDDFLMAGKSMSTFPVAMSLIASFMSAISLLGTPSEVYQNGIIYWNIAFAYIITTFGAAYLYLPVFWNLQVTSAYEYLEMRFSRAVRLLGSSIFILQMVMYMAIVVYAPALALEQVTGLNLYLSVCLICIVCVFYTTIGGMKSVLWTDALQVIVMYCSLFFIVGKGIYDLGGFQKIWEHSTPSGRTTLFDFDVDPRARHTFWSLTFGGYFTWIFIYGVNQAQVQRYLCVKEKRQAIQALYLNLFGLLVLVALVSFAGLVIFTRYACDPKEANQVSKYDQLFPFFVVDTLGSYKGVPGLFIAGIFSGALSTVSSGINSLAAITLEDYVKGLCFPNISEKRATLVSKILSFTFGLITFGLVFVAELLGDVLSAALGLFGIIGGPLLGVFTLGMLFPWANSKGALVGTISSFIFTLWLGVGKEINKASIVKNYGYPVKQCINESIEIANMSTTVPPYEPIILSGEEGLEIQFYKISYMWYSAIGCMLVIIIGLIVSAITGFRNIRTLNPKLLFPLFFWLQRFIPNGSTVGVDYESDEDLELKSQNRYSNPGELNLAFAEFNGNNDNRNKNPPPYNVYAEKTKL